MTTCTRAMSAIITVLVLDACAGTGAHRKPNTETEAAVQDSSCLTQTGSRIAANGTTCTAVGRAYSHDDINRTGATTADEALRLLDPSVTIHH